MHLHCNRILRRWQFFFYIYKTSSLDRTHGRCLSLFYYIRFCSYVWAHKYENSSFSRAVSFPPSNSPERLAISEWFGYNLIPSVPLKLSRSTNDKCPVCQFGKFAIRLSRCDTLRKEIERSIWMLIFFFFETSKFITPS